MSASIERQIAVLALAVAVLASCTPILREDLGSGDHAVTTYVRLFGAEGARINNERLAEQTCPDGIIRLNEGFGMDADGYYRRLEYGCLAP